MALIHRVKTTHCYSATSEHFQDFFGTLTQMYDDQTHTDVHLVAGDGTLFGVHRMIIGGPSSFLRNIFPAEEPCECNRLTVILPDFEAATIKNLLGLLYTGTCEGDCSENDLRDLIKVLKMDLDQLQDGGDPKEDINDISVNNSTNNTTTTTTKSSQFKISHSYKASTNNQKRVVSNASIGSRNRQLPSALPVVHHRESLHSRGDEDEALDMDDDEMLEVTPDVQMYMGNHFMSEMLNGGGRDGDEGPSDDEPPQKKIQITSKPPQLKLRKTSNLLTDPNNLGERLNNIEATVSSTHQQPNNGGGGSKTNVIVNNTSSSVKLADDIITTHLGSSSSGITITPALIGGIRNNSITIEGPLGGGGLQPGSKLGHNGPGTPNDGAGEKQYLCRLCGRTAPSGAALFAHLLYPHYAHLWRTEIPHRANQYLCKQCPYTTTKRQHFVQHVAKVHEDLKKKLSALGENLEVLDNLNPKNTNTNMERIISKVAKFKTSDDLPFDDNLASSGEYSNVNSPIAMNDTIDHVPVVDRGGGLAGGGGGMLPNSNHSTPVINNGGGGTNTPLSTGKSPANSKIELNSFGLIPGRFPRGYKPFVKCRLCGKGWKGKDNFFTHLVSTHFKHLWSSEVPKHADMFQCHVGSCQYQSKYRYNFLFHLAGKHKQLKEKLSQDGISLDVLVPIEVDEVDEEMLAGGSPTLLKTQSLTMQQQHFINNEVSMQKFLAATAPPPNSGGGGRTPSHGKYSAANSTVRLICRVCKKISFNHTCHRQHVVSKHFQDFWADKCPDQTGLFHCHHCDYQTPNRSVFVIHLAYTHSELKTKLKESGNNPDFADPDVYGKRKYRRSHYDNTQHMVRSITGGNREQEHRRVSGDRDGELHRDHDRDLDRGHHGNHHHDHGGHHDVEGLDHSPPHMPPPALATLPKGVGQDLRIVALGSPPEVHGGANGAASPDSDQEKLLKFVCRLCKTEFTSKKAIVEHLALAHFYQVWEDDRPENASFYVPPEGPFVCPHCPFTSSSRAAYIAHIVNQHEALKTVMSLQYGDKTIEDLYTVSSGVNHVNEDETYDEGDDDDDDEELDDDEDGVDEDMEEDMDDEMDGQLSDMEFNDSKMNNSDSMSAAATAEASGW